MKRERAKGKTQEQAAARAAMSVRTARRYEQLGKLPSEIKQPRRYRTRPKPFADDWAWVTTQLERDPAIQTTTIFCLLCERHPRRYQEEQLRSLQRKIASWRIQYGLDREVMFPQVHEPGRMVQSDFTHMGDLHVTIGGVAFPHLLYHLVFTYSNVEAVALCAQREAYRIARLRRQSGLPLEKTFETWISPAFPRLCSSKSSACAAVPFWRRRSTSWQPASPASASPICWKRSATS